MNTHHPAPDPDPDEPEQIAQLASEVFDLVDQTVAAISDDDITAALNGVLASAAVADHLEQTVGCHIEPQDAVSDVDSGLSRSGRWTVVNDDQQSAWAEVALARAAAAAAHTQVGAARAELRKAHGAIAAARQQAHEVVTGAKAYADEQLDHAATIVHDAKEEAARLIADAQRQAESIVEQALIADAERRAAAARAAQSREATTFRFAVEAERLAGITFSPRTALVCADLPELHNISSGLSLWFDPGMSGAEIMPQMPLDFDGVTVVYYAGHSGQPPEVYRRKFGYPTGSARRVPPIRPTDGSLQLLDACTSAAASSGTLSPAWSGDLIETVRQADEAQKLRRLMTKFMAGTAIPGLTPDLMRMAVMGTGAIAGLARCTQALTVVCGHTDRLMAALTAISPPPDFAPALIRWHNPDLAAGTEVEASR